MLIKLSVAELNQPDFRHNIGGVLIIAYPNLPVLDAELQLHGAFYHGCELIGSLFRQVNDGQIFKAIQLGLNLVPPDIIPPTIGIDE